MRPLFTLLMALASAEPALADESDCASFLQQDIHNKIVLTDRVTNKQVSSSSFCQNNASASSSGISVEYAGVGIGFDQADALTKAMCDSKSTQSDLLSNHSAYQAVVDPSIIQAALECYKLNAKGLHYAIHTDLATHSFTASMSYDGPNPISVLDINIVGNAKCDGELFRAWTASSTKKVTLTPSIRALTCMPLASIDVKSPEDIAAGSISIITDAGPIYAQIPRRFSPSLEKQFETMQAAFSTLRGNLNEVQSNLAVVNGPQKICGIDVVGARIELSMVPHDWTSAMCRSYHEQIYPPPTIGSVMTRLGCLNKNGLSLGNGDAVLPGDNSCGW